MKWKPLTLLAAICLCSVGLITLVDNAVASVLGSFAPSLQWVAWVRVPSLVVCAVLFVMTNPVRTFRFPRGSAINFSVVTLAVLWLVPAAYFVLIARVWVPSLPRWIDVVAFMATGLLAEEFLFRGAIFQMVARVMGSRRIPVVSVAVIVSSVFFAVQHIQYHGFQWSPAAGMQIGYTFCMGIVFGLLREKTGSIWPPIVVHLINNSFTLWRNFL